MRTSTLISFPYEGPHDGFIYVGKLSTDAHVHLTSAADLPCIPARPSPDLDASFLFNWLDLLAFSLSGMKAEGTSCAAMAYVMADLHREGAMLGEL